MADIAPPTFKKRAPKTAVRKRAATPPPNDSDSDSYTSEDESGARVKRRRKNGVQVASAVRRKDEVDLSKSSAFAADRTNIIATTDDATKTSAWYTEASSAATAAIATARQNRENQLAENPEGAYKGSAAYGNHIQKDKEPGKLAGPVKQPTNVRMITTTDFAPDVCKDYKQTGFCGYGDGCKFLHAREDYKQGWQLDKEWEKVGKDKKGGGVKVDEELDDEAKMLEGIPFKCIICKEDYKRPVVTRCGHYFCEKCAMTRYMKGKKTMCANCGADTGGTFNTARKLSELLEKKRKREEAKEEEAEGEETSKV
ncbi:RNA-splicing factor [Elasticomyces elasticus]|nr:RNA-splicing factor [Elasticomyces elasticus]KAK3662587.1 RNA-splicing factor [Elasticomyces elasticus]KAK4927931.1 RNA-splicing factor [Elasticomyces elasticus]KAK5756072.1 RNA-splicing factor [Elasticomyces elasticus]